ncbi:MAG: hypothetical protein LAE24_09480 [Candidatus Contendobacter sp.]|nr:hypothetical protein [Candidatus Contendobacter sp.]
MRHWQIPLLWLLAALLAGAAAVDLLFGKMYALTLAFSLTLLGETLDYPTYLFSHRQAGETVRDTLRGLWPTLRLCAATTMLGCLAMIAPDVPGLSQLGVFTIAGITAAAATTRRWLAAERGRSYLVSGFAGRNQPTGGRIPYHGFAAANLGRSADYCGDLDRAALLAGRHCCTAAGRRCPDFHRCLTPGPR